MDVMVVHGEQKRKGRGFSCKEIEEAGVSCEQFDKMKLPWDSRRRTSYKENVDMLKKMEKPKMAPKPANAPKAAKPAVKQ